LYGAGGNLHCEIDDISDALSFVSRRQKFGAISVKSYNQPCRAARQQILAAAKQLNMDVVPEGGMAFYWNLNQIIDGHTTIEHSLPMAPLYDDVITLFALSGTAYTPTFIVNYGGLMGEEYWYNVENVWENQKLMSFVPNANVRSRSMRREKAKAPDDYHHFKTAESVVKIARKIPGQLGLVEAGAHGQLQGLGFHWEMQMFEQGNFTALEVLYAATKAGATALGLNSLLGSLEPGKLADLVIYEPQNNPLSSVQNAENVFMVMKDGKLYDAQTMNMLQPTAKQRPPGPIINTPHV